MTSRIVGLDKPESDVILNYLYDVYERNVDIQVRFKWTPRTSALWDNRTTIHNASWDYGGQYETWDEGDEFGGEAVFLESEAPTRRQALGIAGPDDV